MRLSLSCFGLLLANPNQDEVFKMIKDAGFDCVDHQYTSFDDYWDGERHLYPLGDDYIERAKRTRENLDKAGLVCNQSHAPFGLQYKEPFDESCFHFKELVRSLEAASILGAPHTALHPVPRVPTYDEFVEYNAKFYKSLIPYCEKYNIKIALESSHAKFREDGVLKVYQHSAQNFIDIIKEVDSPYIVALIDTGHAAGNGMGLKPEDYIANMGDDIIAGLHIQDSDYLHDNHTTPFFQYLNWEEIMKALSDIGYKGDFTYEDVNVRRFFPQELTVNTLKYRARVARYLVDIFNKYEKEKGRL